jgi:hypothetical protein
MAQKPVLYFCNGQWFWLLNDFGVSPLIFSDTGTGLDPCCCSCEGFPSPCLVCYEELLLTETEEVSWPTGVTQATVQCWGRGGDGGSSAVAGQAGGGGGGGAFASISFSKTDTSLTVTVNDLSNSYDTMVQQVTGTLTTYCLAAHGEDGADGPNGAGGLGGAAGDCIGDTVHSGGDGADGTDGTAGTEIGGGGGGGAGSLVAGHNGSSVGVGGGPALRRGGRGGDGGVGNLTLGSSGQNYGGGGGGATDGLSGYSGGDGLARILWWKPMTLTVSVSGAPGGIVECDCPAGPGNAAYERWEIMWDALSTTFSLTQDTPGSSLFNWYATVVDGDCRSSADAILIETNDIGSCGESGEFVLIQTERYVTSVSVQLDCVDGKMYPINLQFNTCLCTRTFDVGTSTWSAWGCDTDSTIGPCSFGSVLQSSPPCCTGNTMQVEIFWPSIYGTDCPKIFDCFGTPTSGSVTASLDC